jgi:Domain of unknown function (DUF6487)
MATRPTSDDALPCPKCNGQMQQGFVVDNIHGGRYVSHWAPGQPRNSLWSITKLPDGSLPVGAFRCRECGYLESYARGEFAAE